MLHCNSEVSFTLVQCVGSGNINNQDRIRLDTFIKNATVRMERVTDHGQSTEDFWQMTYHRTLTNILI